MPVCSSTAAMNSPGKPPSFRLSRNAMPLPPPSALSAAAWPNPSNPAASSLPATDRTPIFTQTFPASDSAATRNRLVPGCVGIQDFHCPVLLRESLLDFVCPLAHHSPNSTRKTALRSFEFSVTRPRHSPAVCQAETPIRSRRKDLMQMNRTRSRFYFSLLVALLVVLANLSLRPASAAQAAQTPATDQ